MITAFATAFTGRKAAWTLVWCWEIVDTADGTVVESSWATHWTDYNSSPEALRAGIIRLTDLTRQAVFLFEVAVH